MTIDLAAIEARANAATPGPWKDNADRNGAWIYSETNTAFRINTSHGCTFHDERFIAHAREDIPAIIAHIRTLEAEAARLREACEAAYQCIGPPSDHSPHDGTGWYEVSTQSAAVLRDND